MTTTTTIEITEATTDEELDEIRDRLETERDALRDADRRYVLIADEGGSEVVLADDDDAAVDALGEWLMEGDYGVVDHTIWVDGRVKREWGDWEEQITIQIDPDEPACEEGHEHSWQESGPYSHGGGVIYRDRCRHCGVVRVTDTWAQRPDTGEQGLRSVRYERYDDDDDEDYYNHG